MFVENQIVNQCAWGETCDAAFPARAPGNADSAGPPGPILLQPIVQHTLVRNLDHYLATCQA